MNKIEERLEKFEELLRPKISHFEGITFKKNLRDGIFVILLDWKSIEYEIAIKTQISHVLIEFKGSIEVDIHYGRK